MRLLGILSMFLLLLLPFSVIGIVGPPNQGIAQTVPTDSDVLRGLAAVRAATAEYHDVSVAVADGYVPNGGCVEVPGLGAMGVDYINSALLGDFSVEIANPEVLLYIPTEGGLQLAGAEYLQIASIPPSFDPLLPPLAATLLPPPTLFGATFDRLMPGHEPGQPWLYELHVWTWQTNPDGAFAELNPNLRCQLG